MTETYVFIQRVVKFFREQHRMVRGWCFPAEQKYQDTKHRRSSTRPQLHLHALKSFCAREEGMEREYQ